MDKEKGNDSNENVSGKSIDKPITISDPPKKANTWKPNLSSSKRSKKIVKKKITGVPFVRPPQSAEDEEEITELLRKRKSWVWQHFTLYKKYGQIRSACNLCSREYAAEGKNHGTGNQSNHLLSQCPFYEGNDKKQTTLVFPKDDGSGSNLKVSSYSYERCRSKLIKMIIIDEFAFKVVEGEGFKDFVAELQPRFVLPSRVTISRDVMSLYIEMKQAVKNLIRSERVCLTTDSWTSITNLNYMCLTAHWIDKDWKLQKRILSFCVIPNHKGKVLGKMIENRLLDWGIEKLLTVTVDNASSNDGAIAYLKKNTQAWKTTILNHSYLHMRCCAHILNLIVRDGLKHQSGSIYMIRNAIRYVRSSPARFESLKKCAIAEKIDCKKLLCLDVETRWNSTFLMLDTALKFEKAFERLKDYDLEYQLYFKCGGKEVDEDQESENHEDDVETASSGKGKGKHFGPPLGIDWDAARSFVKFLKLFYDVTLKFSSTLDVTSNVFFQQLVAVQTELQKLCKSNDTNVSVMVGNMHAKFSKYWENLDKLNFLLYVAVILDPRYKLRFVKFCLEQIYKGDKDKAVMMLEEVKKTFSTLYKCYLNSDSTRKSTSSSNEIQDDNMVTDDVEGSFSLSFQFEKHLEETDGYDKKSEFDRYLDEAPIKHHADFDLLGWWKTKCNDFPVLSQMARDVLAIPVSTVASESTFSTGKRVLDTYRSSLNPEMVEALVCCQNWLKSNHATLDVQESMKEVPVEEVQQYEDVVQDFRGLGASKIIDD